MKVIEVLAPGLLTTVQDLGREGFGPMGVSPSGAADPVALRIGNRLVGNAAIAAALEMTLLGGTFLFPEGDRKSTRLNSSHGYISYAVFCLKKKRQVTASHRPRP